MGVAGGTDVLVAHFRDCLLGSGAHEHTTGKGSLGLSVEHILIKLVACTVRHTMVYQSIVVHMLPLVGYHAAVKPAFGPLTRHDEIGAVARNAVVQRDDVVVDTAAGLLLDIQIAHSHVLCMRLLKAVKVKTGIVPYVCLYDLRGQKTAVVGGVVAEQQFYLGTVFHDYEHTAVYHQVNVGTQYVDHLHGTVHDDILWHIHHKPVLSQHCIESRHGILVRTGYPCIVSGDKFGMFPGKVIQ